MILFAIFAVPAARAGFNPGAPVSRGWLIAAGFVLIVMIGFRREVGGDWWNYLYIFNYIKAADLPHALSRTEPGYALTNWTAARLGWGIWFPNLVCAIIFSWGLIAFCRRQPNPALALVVAVAYFVIVVAMGYTRQGAALGFVLLAITQQEQGRTLKMIVSLVLAVTFHTSAIIMAPILAIASAKRGFIPLVVLGFLGVVLSYQFLGSIMTLVFRYTETTFTSSGAVPRLLMNLVPAIVFLTFPKRLSKSPAELRLWTLMSLLVLASLLMLFVLPSSAIVDRLGLYLIPLQIVVLSRLPTAFGTRTAANMMLLAAIVAYSLAVEVVWLKLGTWGYKWLPYRNYLWDAGVGKTPPRWYRRAS